MISRVLSLALLLGVGGPRAADQPQTSAGLFDVRAYGASGDGVTLDSPAINRAIDACAAAGGGQVRFPPGRYLSGTLQLKSHTTLYLEAGATLIGTTNLAWYDHLTPAASMPEARWGQWHRALLLADQVEEVTICGTGTIDGNRVFDPTGEERMRGPHTIVLGNSHHVTIRDVSFVDSANYAMYFALCDHVEIRNVSVTGGWDGVHFRGAPGRPCRDVRILDGRFFTGDDAIAGRYWDNTLIRGCILNSSCNGIRLIGPARNLIIQDCLIYGPGVEPHRTSNRNNMLAGINLQPGAWDATEGALDQVWISDVTMHNVTTPFHFSLKPGNTAGSIQVNRVTATGLYRAAASVESWAANPFTNVVFRDVTLEFSGDASPKSAGQVVNAPGVDARPLPAWGLYARNVQHLELDHVRFRCQARDPRPVILGDLLQELTLLDTSFPLETHVPTRLAFTGLAQLRSRGTELPLVDARCLEISVGSGGQGQPIRANQPYSARVRVASASGPGLAKVTLYVDATVHDRWVWVAPSEPTEVVFPDLASSSTGPMTLRCGDQSRTLTIEP